MQIFALGAFILLVIAAALGMRACSVEQKSAAFKSETSAPQPAIIGLPNGGTIMAPPGSPGFEIARYLAAKDGSSRTFVLGGSEFTPWSGTPEPDAEARLAMLAQLLSAYPDARVTITGHTDNNGAADENRRLSLDRAQKVVQLLVSRGANPDQLDAQGMGMDQLVASNDTDKGRAQNRRISITFAGSKVKG